MDRVDVHQHLLGEPLIAALEGRREPPSLVRDGDGDGWTFRVAGEPDSFLAPSAVDVEGREEELRREGIDRALVALSSALGIESLPTAEAEPLLEAHARSLELLPDRFGGWGALQLAAPDPSAVDAALARGCIGISLPAAALVTPAGVELMGPLLERLERREAPLFGHPGPVGAAGPGGSPGSLPPWWPALTDYVSQVQAAWFAFFAVGRAAHPRLRVLWAMLAGGAPLQLERYAARAGVEAPAPDPLHFYDTSSYGPLMLAAVAAAVGPEQLVYGSDRPVVDPRPPEHDSALGEGLLTTNPDRLLNPDRPKGDER